MKGMNRLNWGATVKLFSLMIFLAVAPVIFQVVPAFADDHQEATQLVEKTRLTLDSFMKDKNMGAFRDLLNRAEGVLISPQLLKGAFFIGASGGNAVLLVRDKKTGQWSEPAFYTRLGGEASASRSAVRLPRSSSWP